MDLTAIYMSWKTKLIMETLREFPFLIQMGRSFVRSDRQERVRDNFQLLLILSNLTLMAFYGLRIRVTIASKFLTDMAILFRVWELQGVGRVISAVPGLP